MDRLTPNLPAPPSPSRKKNGRDIRATNRSSDLRARRRNSGCADPSRRRSLRAVLRGRSAFRQASPALARLPAAGRGRRDQAADGTDAAGLGEIDLHVGAVSRPRHGPLSPLAGDRRQLRDRPAAQVGTEGARDRAAEQLQDDLRHGAVEGKRGRRRVGADQRLGIHGRGPAHRHHRQPGRRRRLGRSDQGTRGRGLRA